MALANSVQLTYWGAAAAISGVVLWVLGDMLLPFLIGIAIAYFLDPAADMLERWGLSRSLAVLAITLASLVILLPVVLFITTTLIGQLSALNNFSFSEEKIIEIEAQLKSILPAAIGENLDLRALFQKISAFISERATQLLDGFAKQMFGALVSSAASLINLAVLFLVVPVVAVYMLLDWDRMIAHLKGLLPRDHEGTICMLASEIDRTLAAFIRGMGSVSLILGSYYALGLWAIGLDFGLAIGAFAGLVTFIPYLGAIIGGGLALGFGVFEFWGDWSKLWFVAGIFISGQIIEGNFLTPKLVGTSIGLHPVWLLFALSIFGGLFGFVGLLIALPVAASVGVLVRFFTGEYQKSRLYKGKSDLS